MNEEPTLEQRIDALERKLESIGSITATLMRNYARESCSDRPKEPYIGDEATAEFVRAWAKHWGFKRLRANLVGKGVLNLGGWPIPTTEYGKGIDIQAAFVTGDVEDGCYYTIEELCGEENE